MWTSQVYRHHDKMSRTVKYFTLYCVFLKRYPYPVFEKILFFENNPIFEIHKIATVILVHI